MKSGRDKELKYDPMNSITQDGQKSKGSDRKRFFIKPFTLYNFEEKQLFTVRPRNCIYAIKDDNTVVNKRVGYLVMKI